MRQGNLGNFRREDGYPPSELSERFAAWSKLSGRLVRRWPLLVVAWYAGVIGVALAMVKRHRGPAIICLGVAAMGVPEFCFASLADAIETDRHLLIFHAITGITVCFAGAWVLSAIMQVCKSPGSATAHSSSAFLPGRSS